MTNPRWNGDWCLDCGDDFRYDDTGGYNPPCSCKECDGFYCRSCCRAERHAGDDYERPEESHGPDEIAQCDSENVVGGGSRETPAP